MTKLFNFLFGCTHNHYTFPITTPDAGCHVVCLTCGKEFPYSWDEMCIQKPERCQGVAA